jgi:hypothetical protein
MSSKPVETRVTAAAPPSDSGRAVDAPPTGAPEADPADAARVPHAPQPPHRPAQRAVGRPQSPHSNTVRDVATERP